MLASGKQGREDKTLPHTHTHMYIALCVLWIKGQRVSRDVCKMERRCWRSGICCSVMLMCKTKLQNYRMKEITTMQLLFSDWSGWVNLLDLIGPQRQKAKSMFCSEANFNFQSRCSQMSFLSSEASAIRLFRVMTGEHMCSMLSSLKAKCLCGLFPPCVFALETSSTGNQHRPLWCHLQARPYSKWYHSSVCINTWVNS